MRQERMWVISLLGASELYILWSETSRHKLSPTLATAHYSCRDNAVAQCELSGYVELG